MIDEIKEQIFTIKRWDNNKIIYNCKAQNILEAVERAVKEEVNLSYADLRSADLHSANLSSADLRSANLSSADLRAADLRAANLRSADLHSADLHYADLRSANLHSANLHYAKGVNPVMMLLAYYHINDKINLELMRYDCANLPEGKKLFAKWKKDDVCPYSEGTFQRVANFEQHKKLWSYGKSKTALQLWLMIKKYNEKKK